MVVSPKANKPSNDPLITNIVVLYIYIYIYHVSLKLYMSTMPKDLLESKRILLHLTLFLMETEPR